MTSLELSVFWVENCKGGKGMGLCEGEGELYTLWNFLRFFLFSGIRDPKFLARGQNLTVHRSYLRLKIAYRLLMAGGYMNPAALDTDKESDFFLELGWP